LPASCLLSSWRRRTSLSLLFLTVSWCTMLFGGGGGPLYLITHTSSHLTTCLSLTPHTACLTSAWCGLYLLFASHSLLLTPASWNVASLLHLTHTTTSCLVLFCAVASLLPACLSTFCLPHLSTSFSYGGRSLTSASSLSSPLCLCLLCMFYATFCEQGGRRTCLL